MNRHSLKKAVSVVLTGALMLSTAGCMDFGGSKKAVLEAADALASDMASASASSLIKNSTLDKKSDEAETLEALLGSDLYSDDQLEFFKAVEGTIEYEVDEESVSVNKDAATVDIVFTIADYEEVLKDEFTDIDELTKAIKKADTTEVKFTAEFAKEDKEWIPDNVGSKKFLKLYDYRSAEIKLALTAEMIAGFIDTSMTDWWLAYGGAYLDTSFIEYDYWFDSEVYNYYDRGVILYYTLMKDGSVLYTSGDIVFGESTSIECVVNISDVDPSAQVFDEGTYTISLYMSTGELIDAESVEVEITYFEPNPTGGSGGGGHIDGEGDYFNFVDSGFRDSYVINAEWFSYENGWMYNDCVYYSDAEILAFSIEVTSDCTKTLEYSYCYSSSDDETELGEALDNPVFTSTATPTTYNNGVFYDLDYEVGTPSTGYYILIVSDASTGNWILYAICEVR